MGLESIRGTRGGSALRDLNRNAEPEAVPRYGTAGLAGENPQKSLDSYGNSLYD